MQGTIVNFRVLKGGGSVFAGSAASNKDGIVQERWTLGTSTADSQVVEARGVDSETGASLVFGRFVARPQAGAPSSMTIISGASQSAIVGEPLPDSLLVRVRDQYGNPVSGITVTWAIASGGGSLSSTSSLTNATGHASTKWTVGNTPGSGNTTATAAGLSSSFPVTIKPEEPGSLTIESGNSQTATVDTPIEIAVRVRNTKGVAMAGVAVVFDITDASGAVVSGVGKGLVSPRTATTNASGIATTSWTLAQKAGPLYARAEVASHRVNFTATGAAGAATTIGPAAGDNQTAAPGSAVAVAPALSVKDKFDNGVAGVQTTFAVTSGGGSITGAQAVTNASGVATVGSWTLGSTAGPNTLSATVPQIQGYTFKANAGRASPGLRIVFLEPAENAALGDGSVRVSALVIRDNAEPVTSFKLFYGGREATFMDVQGYEAYINLAGLPSGPILLTATVQDSAGRITDAFRWVVHSP